MLASSSAKGAVTATLYSCRSSFPSGDAAAHR
jgi:hypothetical protein